MSDQRERLDGVEDTSGGVRGGDPIEEEIARLQAEIRERADRMQELRKLRSHPRVIPVRVFWRHHSRYEEEWDSVVADWDVLRSAHAANCYAEDYGQISAEGVSVGGVLITRAELDERYPDIGDAL
jgi:hypothetical protein